MIAEKGLLFGAVLELWGFWGFKLTLREAFFSGLFQQHWGFWAQVITETGLFGVLGPKFRYTGRPTPPTDPGGPWKSRNAGG